MIEEKKGNIVVIPIYKNVLDRYERTSLDYCKKYLNKYHITVISPNCLSEDKIFLDFVKKQKINVRYFDNSFFSGIGGYNKLMLNLDFYKSFSEYRYMLIYQLDALVFSDDLLEWVEKGYDYIGAPWLHNDAEGGFESSGNGGFSLRKIATFISVLEAKGNFFDYSKCSGFSCRSGVRAVIVLKLIKKLVEYNITLNYLKLFLFFYKENEDYFWSFYARLFKEKFSLPSSDKSLKFSFEANPTFCFDCNEHKIPFGAHAWYKYDLNFWLTNIVGLKETLAKYT